MRLLDLDPFEPIGIDAMTLRLLDVFLLHCLLSDSPPDTPEEIAALGRNQNLVAARGREPGLRLEQGSQSVLLAEWAAALLAAYAPIADRLDQVDGGDHYARALATAQAALTDFGQLPSARVLDAIRTRHDDSFIDFVRAQSLQTRHTLLELPYPPELADHFAQLAAASVAAQKHIEATDRVPFERFRQDYLSPVRLGLSQDAVME